MKKGFTLIELLGVIALLGILSLVTVPIIDRTLNQGKSNLYDIQNGQLVKALKSYCSENISLLNSLGDGEVLCKTVNELKNGGYLPDDLKDLKTNNSISGDLKICVKKEATYECDQAEPCKRDMPKYVYSIDQNTE